MLCLPQQKKFVGIHNKYLCKIYIYIYIVYVKSPFCLVYRDYKKIWKMAAQQC